MIVLGLNAYHGDVWAVLLRDRELIAGACLEMAEAGPEDINHFPVSRDPRANLWRKTLFTIRARPVTALLRDRVRNSRRVA